MLDHCTHFDAQTLGNVLIRGGFEPESRCVNVVGKEIFTLVRPLQTIGRADLMVHPEFKMNLMEVAEKYLELCAVLVQYARSLRAENRVFGVMGSSTAAAWLCGELDSAVDFFVDEDRYRVGKTLFDKPILSIAQVPAGACLFIPMSDKTACSIISRSDRNDIKFAYYAENRINEMVQRIVSLEAGSE